MVRRRVWVWLWLAVVSGGRALGAWAADAPIQFITEEWPPYNYQEDGRLNGVSVRLVQALQAELGRHEPIRLYPSMRAKRILESQPRTLMFSMFRTAERESKYKWIGPIGRDAIYFYQRPDSPLQIHSLDDAKAVPVVACRQAGLVYDTLVAAGFSNLEASAYNSKQVYGKLLLGRADLAISDSPQGVRYLLRQLNLPADALQQTPVQLLASDLYIAASPDFPDEEIARWQAALERIKAQGVLERLYQELD
ncbi:ABC transporter substrate-binding protein [Pseudaeromonas paramecii]|uniref:Transporter substrate-binding domain-containing protein n=1 Tax=Pseudaeromonas paramecii TaxID=2138166 RepID=A0ABP8QGZ8_9GAMM